MTKHSYSATFSNGATTTRKSDRVYTAAWLVVFSYSGHPTMGDSTVTRKGFSSTRAAAFAAISRECGTWCGGKVDFSEVTAAQ